ncbi:MAG: lysophospholipid acyltransferase family protein [Burkholderiales bacterium]|nr:lysophospholipid acyltransferase family protein [Burkholderiales bacterium]
MINKLLTNLGLTILRLISSLPISFLNALGGGLGLLGFYLLKKRRNVGILNLSLCFPDMSEADKQRLIKEHFKELIRSGLCYGLIFYASPDKLRKVVEIRGLENYNQVRGKQAVVLLAPHFLALDIGANRLTLETPGYSVYAEQRNAYLTERIKEARLRFIKDQGGEIFSRREGLRLIVRKMKQTLIPFYYLPDQDMDERDSVYVPFFAHPVCATLETLPKLVKLTDAAVIPMATYREGKKYIVELSPVWDNYPSGDIPADVTYMNRYIEKMIMKHPSQYLWLHKRFKTQPNLPRGKLYENC